MWDVVITQQETMLKKDFCFVWVASHVMVLMFQAQGLYGPITTGRKIELSDHHLYIMTDPEGNK